MIACTKRRLHPDPPLGAGSALPVVHSSPGLLSPLDAPTVSDCERLVLGFRAVSNPLQDAASADARGAAGVQPGLPVAPNQAMLSASRGFAMSPAQERQTGARGTAGVTLSQHRARSRPARGPPPVLARRGGSLEQQLSAAARSWPVTASHCVWAVRTGKGWLRELRPWWSRWRR